MFGEPRLEGALDVAIGEAGIAVNRAAMGVFQEFDLLPGGLKPLGIEAVDVVMRDVHEAIAQALIKPLGEQGALEPAFHEADKLVGEPGLLIGSVPFGGDELIGCEGWVFHKASQTKD